MNAPQVSVILTAYNRPQFLAAAIESITAQTLRDIELIIVDDGSSDPRVAKIGEKYATQDSRVRFFKTENGGLPAARNFGAQHASGDYLSWQDDDDISEPERLKAQVEFLEANPNIAIVGCPSLYIDENNKEYGRQWRAKTQQAADIYPSFQEISPASFLIVGPSIMVRKSAFDSIGGFRPWFRVSEDVDFSLRLQEKYAAAFLNKRLYRYRLHRHHLSRGITAWQYACAAYFSAHCRRQSLPDYVEKNAPLEEIMPRLKEMPPDMRKFFIRKGRGMGKYFMRHNALDELRALFAQMDSAFGESDPALLKKARRQVRLWSFWYARPRALFARW